MMAENPGTTVKGFLSKEVAGFPVWVWGLIIVAGIGAAYFIPKLFGGPATTDTTTTIPGTSNIPGGGTTDTGGTGTGTGGGETPTPAPVVPPILPPGRVACKRTYTVPNWPAGSPEYGWVHVARRANTTIEMLIRCNPDVPGLAQGGHGNAFPGETVCAVC